MNLRAPRLLSSALVAAATLAFASMSWPCGRPTYPNRPIRIISPFSAGSPPDAFGRLIAQQFGQARAKRRGREPAGRRHHARHQSRRSGRSRRLHAGQVNAALSYAPVLYPNPGYDPVKSFVPVALLATWTHVLVAHPSVPANTLQELIAYAKANPGKLNIGSPLGNPPHVWPKCCEWNRRRFQRRSLSPGAATGDGSLAGRLQLYFGAGEPMASMIREGKIKAYAVTERTRDPVLPTFRPWPRPDCRK